MVEWEDHVVISALANMFSVTINLSYCAVVTTQPPPPHSLQAVLVPQKCTLSLIMQYHFVGLDKQNSTDLQVPVTPRNRSHVVKNLYSQNTSYDSLSSLDTPLDDVTIEQGDEHTRNITGGPLASIMSVENSE